VGRTIVVDAVGHVSLRVVGILPPDFVYPTPVARDVPDVLVPLVVPADAVSNLRRRSFSVIARIPSSASLDEVSLRLSARSAAIGRDYPPVPARPALSAMTLRTLGPFDSVHLRPLNDYLGGRERRQFAVVMAGVSVLVLLACVNLAGLAIARGEDRRRDLLVQRALGATSWRLSRAVLVEVMLLGAASAVCALALLGPFLALVRRLLPVSLLLIKPPTIDGRVIVFAALVDVTAILAVSLWPARAAARDTSNSAMASGVRSSATGRLRPIQRLLVPAQVAVAFVLLVSGALFIASLVRVWNEDVGYDPDRLVLVEVVTGPGASSTAADRVNAVMAAVSRLPGVERVAAAQGGFLSSRGGFDGSPFRLPPGAGLVTGVTKRISITPGYFETMHARLLAGRLPSDDELETGKPVLVVSQRVAHDYWPGLDAIGRTLEGNAGTFTVIGVVADARYYGLDRASEGEIYLSMVAYGGYSRLSTLLIKTGDSSSVALSDVARAISSANSGGRVQRMVTVDEALGETIRPRRFNSWLFGSLAVVALAVVGTGMFGLLAMTAGRRTREMGIRMALGATQDGIVSLLLFEQLSAVAFGLMAGGVAAAWAVRFLKSYLYGSTAYDPRVWAASVLVIVITAAFGTLVPSLQASRADPVKALRGE
jgi:predicted permease